MNHRNLIAILLLFALVGGVAAAEDGIPLLPDEFRGSVTINGDPAPTGTELTALINGEVRGSLTTTEKGKYGGLELNDRRLIVTGHDGEAGEIITFKIGTHAAKQTSTFRPGETQEIDLSVTYSTGSSTGGGGGGSGGYSSPVVSPTAVVATGEGSLSKLSSNPVKVGSEDKKASLYLPKGTVAQDASGKTLSEISIKKATSTPDVSGGANFAYAGYSCECGPEGATFSPAITLSFTIPEEDWFEGRELKIKWYNSATGIWEDLETTVDADTHTVSARVSHFSSFALFTESAAETAVTSTETPVSATPEPGADDATPASGEPEIGALPWTAILMVIVVVGVVAGAVLYMKKE